MHEMLVGGNRGAAETACSHGCGNGGSHFATHMFASTAPFPPAPPSLGTRAQTYTALSLGAGAQICSAPSLGARLKSGPRLTTSPPLLDLRKFK
eukprot:358811-Chlamydomonas_euryale.AAC.23